MLVEGDEHSIDVVAEGVPELSVVFEASWLQGIKRFDVEELRDDHPRPMGGHVSLGPAGGGPTGAISIRAEVTTWISSASDGAFPIS